MFINKSLEPYKDLGVHLSILSTDNDNNIHYQQEKWENF